MTSVLVSIRDNFFTRFIIINTYAEPLNDYNALWIDEWKNTLNFQMWKTKVDLSLVKDDPPHHPGMGLQGATLMGQVNRQFNRVGTALAPLTQQIKDKTTAIVSGLKTEKKSDDSSDEEHVHPQDGPEVHEEPHPTEKPAEVCFIVTVKIILWRGTNRLWV